MSYFLVVIIIFLGVFLKDKSDIVKSQRKRINEMEKTINELKEKLRNSDSAKNWYIKDNYDINSSDIEKIAQNNLVQREQVTHNYSSKENESITYSNAELETEEKVFKENSTMLNSVSQQHYSEQNINNNINNKETLSKEDMKNNNILLTGSVLIVLSAIVFLTSTWNTIPNIVKTLVLVIFIGIFLGISKIAKEKLNLEKTSKAFFNISMAYIPICLIGISYWGLLGEYLSIKGNGGGIYLALVATFLSLLYYKISKDNHSNGYLISSVFSQYSAVIAFVSYIEFDLIFLSSIILLYNISILVISKEKILQIISGSVLYIISAIFVMAILYNGFDCIQLKEVFLALVISISYFIMNFKNNNIINYSLANISLILLSFVFLQFDSLNITNNVKEIMNLIILIGIYSLYNFYVKNKEKLLASSIIIAISIALNYLGFDFIKLNIYLFIISIILTVSYCRKLFEDDINEFIEYVIPVSYLISAFCFILENNLSSYFYIIISILAWIVSLCLYKNRFKDKVFMISHAFILISYIGIIIKSENEIINNIFSFILVFIYIISYIKYKKNYVLKYLAYIAIGNYIVNILMVLHFNYFCYVLPIYSLIILEIEIGLKSNVKDKYSDKFLLGCFSLSFISLAVGINIAHVLVAFILSIVLLGISYLDKKEKMFNIVSLSGLLLVIVCFGNIYLKFILGFLVLGMSLVRRGNNHEYAIISLLGFISCGYPGSNMLLLYILLLLWSGSHWIVKENSGYIYKLSTYIFGFLLYYELLKLIGFDKYISALLFGIDVLAILAFEITFKKDLKKSDYENLKWIFWMILYLWALKSYFNITDGMVSVGMMIVVVIVSYYLKDGKVLLVNLVAILVNVFGLTRAFWLSIPWWIYLLVIGFILVGFAIMNEAREKDKKINLSDVVKSLKDKFDK